MTHLNGLEVKKLFHRHKWRKYPKTGKVERLGMWTRYRCRTCKEIKLT